MSDRALARLWRRYARETGGSAAVEFAIWLGALMVPTFAALEVGLYGFQALQVHNAAQMAANAGAAACKSTSKQPATQKCGAGGATLNTAIQEGERTTPLGSLVTMAADNPTGTPATLSREEFWCPNSTTGWGFTEPSGITVGKIATASGDVDTTGNDTAGSPGTATCSFGSGGKTTPPGDYIVVTVQYTFNPIFSSLHVVNLLGGAGSKITQTAWTRIG